MSAVTTVSCLVPGCHGVLVTRNGTDLTGWDSVHAGECPAPEPQALANLRTKLYDLEECDDPDYEDWKRRIDTEFMPLITVAAHLMVSDGQTETPQPPAEDAPYRPSSEFPLSLNLAAQTPADTDPRSPAEARQFGVQTPDGKPPAIYGDQEWVRDGRALTVQHWPGDGEGLVHAEGSAIVERDIQIRYSDWRPVNTAPPVGDQAETVKGELRDRPGETVRIEGDRRASVAELADVLVAEFGGYRPGETSIRAAIRVLREQRAQLAEAQDRAQHWQNEHRTLSRERDTASDEPTQAGDQDG